MFQIGFIVLAGLTFVYYAAFVSLRYCLTSQIFALKMEEKLTNLQLCRGGEGKSLVEGSSSPVKDFDWIAVHTHLTVFETYSGLSLMLRL